MARKNSTESFDSVLLMVGTPGVEPGASWTRTKRDTKLRHVPLTVFYYMPSRKKSQGKTGDFYRPHNRLPPGIAMEENGTPVPTT